MTLAKEWLSLQSVRVMKVLLWEFVSYFIRSWGKCSLKRGVRFNGCSLWGGFTVLLSASYSELIGREVWHLFTFIRHLYNHELAREKILDPRITHEKKFLTHEIPTRRNFGSTKYPREKHSGPRWHNGTMTRDPQWQKSNLAHWLKASREKSWPKLYAHV